MILYAMTDDERSSAGLLRASALARVLESDLQVVRVGPGLGTGDLVEQVVALSAELRPELIVMSPQDGHLGIVVTILARATGVPVLLAREAGSRESIIAATDLGRPDFPVLQRAAKLGAHLEASVVGIHNVNPPRAPTTWTGVEPDLRRQVMTRAWAELQVDAESVVTTEADPTIAILREVRDRDADIVVVGTYRRSLFRRPNAGYSVAARIVEDAPRSVLVTPIEI